MITQDEQGKEPNKGLKKEFSEKEEQKQVNVGQEHESEGPNLQEIKLIIGKYLMKKFQKKNKYLLPGK